MGNTDKPGEHVENIITRENVNHSKEDIEEITNENTARDSVKKITTSMNPQNKSQQ